MALGLGLIENLKIDNERQILVNQPLAPRARFEVAVEILGAEKNPPTAISLTRQIDWTVQGGDPDREGVSQLGLTDRDAPPRSRQHPRRCFGDLPPNATIEFETAAPGAAWAQGYELSRHRRARDLPERRARARDPPPRRR